MINYYIDKFFLVFAMLIQCDSLAVQEAINKKFDQICLELKYKESAQLLMLEFIGYLEAMMDLKLINHHQFIKNIRKFDCIQHQQANI